VVKWRIIAVREPETEAAVLTRVATVVVVVVPGAVDCLLLLFGGPFLFGEALFDDPVGAADVFGDGLVTGHLGAELVFGGERVAALLGGVGGAGVRADLAE
jgi:hypothetical protein